MPKLHLKNRQAVRVLEKYLILKPYTFYLFF